MRAMKQLRKSGRFSGHTDITQRELDAVARRSAEWREFRRQFRFSQVDLADALAISRRTVLYIEGQKILQPSSSTLKAFAELKRNMETEEAA
jgi:DNA-binding XRE family transcriptional regulator